MTVPWIVFGVDSGRRMVLYSISSAKNKAELDPPGWTLYGRKSPSDEWIEIDRQTRIKFSERKQRKLFWIRKTGKFVEYKFQFDLPAAAASPANARVQLGRIEFLACISDVASR